MRTIYIFLLLFSLASPHVVASESEIVVIEKAATPRISLYSEEKKLLKKVPSEELAFPMKALKLSRAWLKVEMDDTPYLIKKRHVRVEVDLTKFSGLCSSFETAAIGVAATRGLGEACK